VKLLGKKDKKETIKKIIFCGLDNSGKSSYIAQLRNQNFPLHPTTGVERAQYEVFGFPILLWDFGGQTKLRESYFDKTHFFDGTNLLFYLIDIQDEARFNESLSYFENLLNIFTEKPLILVLFHKVDPDIAKSQKVLNDIELLKNRLKAPLKKFEPFYFSTTIFDYSTILVPFSFALSKLLPFTEVLNSYISNFLQQHQLTCVLLLDKSGGIINQIAGSTKEDKTYLQYAQITGTNLTQLFESYQKEKMIPPEISIKLKEESKKDSPAGIIIFEQISILDRHYYLTILTKAISKLDTLKETLPEFIIGLAKTIEMSY